MRLAVLVLLLVTPLARADARAAAVDRGLAWLAAHQADNGSWGKRYPCAVTAFACLAWLGASDEPFAGERGAPLRRGLAWLIAHQEDGVWPQQGHTWIHGQGFATLALAEAYGRLRRCRQKPDLDPARLKRILEAAVAAIAQHQSASGGWWYTPDDPAQHEGSTTVCAVQALVSAARYGIASDPAVLERGFAYLKRCQNPDGGFDYKEGPGETSMKEGTAADVATLALMQRFDYQVMVSGVGYLEKLGVEALSRERFPYYAFFYGTMGMRLFGEEMGAKERTDPWIAAAHRVLLGWQQEDGAWPVRGWIEGERCEDGAYPTAFATLVLTVPDARLSLFVRAPSH